MMSGIIFDFAASDNFGSEGVHARLQFGKLRGQLLSHFGEL